MKIFKFILFPGPPYLQGVSAARHSRIPAVLHGSAPRRIEAAGLGVWKWRSSRTDPRCVNPIFFMYRFLNKKFLPQMIQLLSGKRRVMMKKTVMRQTGFQASRRKSTRRVIRESANAAPSVSVMTETKEDRLIEGADSLSSINCIVIFCLGPPGHHLPVRSNQLETRMVHWLAFKDLITPEVISKLKF